LRYFCPAPLAKANGAAYSTRQAAFLALPHLDKTPMLRINGRIWLETDNAGCFFVAVGTGHGKRSGHQHAGRAGEWLPRLKLLVKAGGTNVTNQPYCTFIGGPAVGGLSYTNLIWEPGF
jgi:hypothetical protein